MFHSRGVKNSINYLPKQSLQIAYKDKINSFEDILKRDKLFTIQQRKIQSLATELFKVKENPSNNIMYDIFQTRKINCSSRSQTGIGPKLASLVLGSQTKLNKYSNLHQIFLGEANLDEVMEVFKV